MSKRSVAVCSLLCMIAATIGWLFMLNMTNPSTSGPAGILVVLVLIYILADSFIVLVALSLGYIYRLIAPRRDSVTTSAEKARRSLKKLLIVCAVLAATPILAISLNSIGRMDFMDIALIVTAEMLAVFYAVKKL